MKTYVFLVLICVITSSADGQKTDRALQRKIEKLVTGFNGEVALYVKNLRTGKTVMINADSIYPTASIVKVPILIGVMDKLNNNELTFHQELVYHDSLLYPGVDILGSFKVGEKIALSKLMMLMMTMSDNTASIWLQKLAGSGTRINALMDSLGYTHTRVNARTPGREAIRERYGWGQTTPREIATLLENIYRGRVLSPEVSARMLRLMNRNYWDAAAVSQIPPYATIFSKNGALNEYRSEVVLVRGVSSEYVFCVITNNNKDTSWRYENEAWSLIRNISATLWNYYEPANQWHMRVSAIKFY